MKGLPAVFFVLAIIVPLTLSHAMDWKRLHEQADKISLSDALGLSGKNPGSVENLYLLGLVYLNLHKDKEAKEAFARMEAIDPGSLEALWGRAEVARRAHDLNKAEKLLSEVISKDRNFPPALVSLAYIRYVRMDFKGSVGLAYKVAGLGRDNVDQGNLARAYLLIGGGRGMLAHYGGLVSKIANGTAVLYNLKKAEELKPDSAAVLFGMGSFYFLAPSLAGGDKDKARIYLEKAVQADPFLADAYVRLAQLYARSGSREKSEFYLRRAEELDPQNELLLDTRSGACRFICGGGD